MRQHFLRKATNLIHRSLGRSNRDHSGYDDVVGQKLLIERFRNLRSGQHLRFRDIGWGLYSQHDEDGILLYIFSRIGVTTYRSAEICSGNGIECNTANLLLNHRWTGLLLDGSAENVRTAKEFYRSRAETRHWPPDIVHRWLTRDNLNDVVSDAGYSGAIDLLSLDVDGMDYWLWEALEVITPRVVVLEFNHLMGPEVSVSVPYDPNFVAEFSEYGTDYAGASLGAFIKLGARKGYRLAGTNSIGTNAFFVRDEIPVDLVPESEPGEAFNHPRAQFGMRERYKNVQHKDWVQV